MAVPVVAITGRPNVGKSSLFNWLAGKQISVVDPMAGVTRDRLTYLMHERDRYFELMDTGGMGIVDPDDLTEEVETQIRLAIEQSDLVLLVVDGSQGVLPLDREVADRLRHVDKPKLLVVNKCDSPRTDQEVAEFYALTDAPAVLTSVKANRNRDELLAAIIERLPPSAITEGDEGATLSEEPDLKLAIVGRRNVGKSTFINALAESERVIVSEVPGTTRDSIDVRFEVDGRAFIAIDTPGVRKRKSLASDVEYYGLVRAQRSIRRADVVLMFFDSQSTISKVDKKLVAEILREHKPCIFVINKWDLALEEGMTVEAWSKYLIKTFASTRHVPLAFLTARDDRNTRQVINLAQAIFKQSRERVQTRMLNKVVRAAIDANPPPHRRNRRPKIFFAVQVATQPPTIVLKCNEPGLFDETWKRYLLGVFRERLPFQEVPIKVYYRPRGESDAEQQAALAIDEGDGVEE